MTFVEEFRTNVNKASLAPHLKLTIPSRESPFPGSADASTFRRNSRQEGERRASEPEYGADTSGLFACQPSRVDDGGVPRSFEGSLGIPRELGGPIERNCKARLLICPLFSQFLSFSCMQRFKLWTVPIVVKPPYQYKTTPSVCHLHGIYVRPRLPYPEIITKEF